MVTVIEQLDVYTALKILQTELSESDVDPEGNHTEDRSEVRPRQDVKRRGAV